MGAGRQLQAAGQGGHVAGECTQAGPSFSLAARLATGWSAAVGVLLCLMCLLQMRWALMVISRCLAGHDIITRGGRCSPHWFRPVVCSAPFKLSVPLHPLVSRRSPSTRSPQWPLSPPSCSVPLKLPFFLCEMQASIHDITTVAPAPSDPSASAAAPWSTVSSAAIKSMTRCYSSNKAGSLAKGRQRPGPG